MLHARSVALSFALVLAAGCASGGSATPPSPAPQQPQSLPQYPAESSAARHILADVGRGTAASRSAQHAEDEDDDGGRGELQLPTLTACRNGTYATDCTAWLYGTTVAGVPPPLNFCRDLALYPGDLGPSATPLFDLTPATFSLTYAGKQSPPVVAFATRWWTVSVTNGFRGSARTAPAISVAPTAAGANAATRGWLVFFTWSWPADVLLVPYAINQIQVGRSAAPLAVPPAGRATLRAFDCLGRTIAASKSAGSGFGFSADLSLTSTASTSDELIAPVFGGTAPGGSIALSDDRGAQRTVPVVAATPSPYR